MDGEYGINLDEYSDIGTHWIAFYALSNNVTYFHSFIAEHIPKEIKSFISNKSTTTDIFRIEAYDSVILDIFVLDLLILCLMEKA